MDKKPIAVERLTQVQIKELAREFFDKKWWQVNAEYLIPDNVVLLAQHGIGARGYLHPPSYKWVHLDDYKEAIKLLEKAKEVLQ